jgi:hypothetical protein
MYLICTRGVPIELESDKSAKNQVQNDQILTFRVLASGVEAGQACVIHRSSTHTTTLTRMGSMGFTCVPHEAGERSKFECQSRISIVNATSCGSPTDPALHALGHTHYLHT